VSIPVTGSDAKVPLSKEPMRSASSRPMSKLPGSQAGVHMAARGRAVVKGAHDASARTVGWPKAAKI
jgi:hypothetical protein